MLYVFDLTISNLLGDVFHSQSVLMSHHFLPILASEDEICLALLNTPKYPTSRMCDFDLGLLCRMPITQASTSVFLLAVVPLMQTDQWKCPDATTMEDAIINGRARHLIEPTSHNHACPIKPSNERETVIHLEPRKIKNVCNEELSCSDGTINSILSLTY